MKKKLAQILLVEDDRSINFLNKHVIEKVECTEHIRVTENGQQALDYIKSGIEDNQLLPDLIFLDINMPVINGWEFLEEFKSLEIDQKDDMVIVMLTSSVNPDDKKKAKTIKEVSGYKNKPLTQGVLKNILEEHFVNRL